MGKNGSSDKWLGIIWIIVIVMWLVIKVHSCQQSDSEQEDTSYTEYSDESSSSIRSWIVGDWRLTTPYGDEIVHFKKDGTCRMVDSYGVHYGTFSMTSSYVRIKYSDDPTTTTIEIDGQSLYAGGGYYYTKQ